MYILDTNTLIYYFKDQGNVKKHFLTIPYNQLYIPSIVLYELKVGIAKSTSPFKRQSQLNQLQTYVSILPFTEKEAETASIIRATLEKQGTPIGTIDGLIAGTALTYNAVLVTHNTREFERIKGLKIVDWYE